MFYGNPSAERVRALARFLRDNPQHLLRLYHGTAARLPILDDGLRPTTARTARSLQSGHGYVYLTVYPGQARFFAQMAYPQKAVTVYAVTLPVALCRPDRDQLRNQRYWAGRIVRNTLADSLAWGHGVAVRERIFPDALSVWTPDAAMSTLEH